LSIFARALIDKSLDLIDERGITAISDLLMKEELRSTRNYLKNKEYINCTLPNPL